MDITRLSCRTVTYDRFFYFFSVRLLSVLRGHSVFFIPATTANDLRLRRISIPDLIHYIYFLILILEKCWVLNKGTTGTIFVTSLVWRSPWLGIEPGTSRTRWPLWRGWKNRMTTQNRQKSNAKKMRTFNTALPKGAFNVAIHTNKKKKVCIWLERLLLYTCRSKLQAKKVLTYEEWCWLHNVLL